MAIVKIKFAGLYPVVEKSSTAEVKETLSIYHQ